MLDRVVLTLTRRVSGALWMSAALLASLMVWGAVALVVFSL